MEQNTNNTMINSVNKPTMLNIGRYITNVFSNACQKAFPVGPNFKAQVVWNSTMTSDLTCPSAMKIYNMNSRKEGWTLPSSKEVAQEIIANVNEDTNEKLIGEILISQQQSFDKSKGTKDDDKKGKPDQGNFYMDINLKDSWVQHTANELLKKGIKLDSKNTGRKVLVDFSSPNIAKEMHVGHLRSTILGDSICRILEYLGNDVKRINHVGDWGTQFGMLIAYLEEKFPNYADNIEIHESIKDLENFYKNSKVRFDSDEDFKRRAHEKTVLLQTGNAECRKAWQFICDVSRGEFNKIYKRLNIKLEEMGESFYDPICRKIVPELTEKGFVIKDQGALVMKIPGFKIPMMLVKSDGGLTYDTTDLAALSHRLNTMERDWVIYVIGSEQELHLKLLYEAGKIVGWHKPPQTRLDHMAFGMMLGADGKKIKTREGENIKLTQLLDEAKDRAKAEIQKRVEGKSNFTPEYIEEASHKLGYSAVKYFDLKQFRASQYKFSFDHMLDDKGNTAVYLFYSYVRICSLYTKAKMTPEEMDKLIATENIVISHKKERELLVHLLKFNDVIDDVLEDLAINKLCDYLYGIAVRFAEFYEECKIVGDEKMNSRLLIAELTKRFMTICFDLLGLTPIEKI